MKAIGKFSVEEGSVNMLGGSQYVCVVKKFQQWSSNPNGIHYQFTPKYFSSIGYHSIFCLYSFIYINYISPLLCSCMYSPRV